MVDGSIPTVAVQSSTLHEIQAIERGWQCGGKHTIELIDPRHSTLYAGRYRSDREALFSSNCNCFQGDGPEFSATVKLQHAFPR